MPVCALRHFVLEIFGKISVSSLLISGRLKTECYSNYNKRFDMILKQPILVRENVPIPLKNFLFDHAFEKLLNMFMSRVVVQYSS